MQRIQSITLRNFKFFYGTEKQQPQNKIELNGNNILLYGENGSGKSSIYWALYTHLQSCLKKDKDIKKYFDVAEPENLRNRYAKDTDNSAIILEIKDDSGTRNIEISNKNIETNTSSDKTINKIIAGSDFINYKYLAKLYDFRNSQKIDLFSIFEREIFMFIDLGAPFTDNQGNASQSYLASDWWKFINDAPKSFTPNAKNYKTPKRNSDEYIRYINTTLPKFIDLLKSFLIRVATKANRILKEEFKEELKLNFNTDSIKCTYNNKIVGCNIDAPKIPLTIENPHFPSGKENINNPHTFLNEARLSAIALAIRLAMLEERLDDEDSASLLVLDDLLLSLDMSNRDKVLDIILKKVDEYQILILTHDRAFYNLCKRRIEYRTNQTDKFQWEFKEMYQSSVEGSDIPCPFIPVNNSNLDLAKKYLHEFDYPACANYLRKESERVLIELLPLNKTIGKDLDNGSQRLLLNALISKFEEYCGKINLNFEPFEKLKEYKDLLMNPLSHHNIESPIYKQEILNTFSVLEKLNSINILRFEADLEKSVPFMLKEIDNAGDEWEYTFYLNELFLITKNVEGKWTFNNPKCLFAGRVNKSQNGEFEAINIEFKINEGYDKIRHTLGIKVDGIEAKELKDILFKENNLLTKYND